MEQTTIILNRIDLLDKLENENKISKEALKAELENDEFYLNLEIEAKQANDRKKEAKDKVFASEECQKLLQGIKENADEIVILKEILSAELVEYYQENKTNEIEDSNGNKRKFVINSKLLKPKQLNLPLGA